MCTSSVADEHKKDSESIAWYFSVCEASAEDLYCSIYIRFITFGPKDPNG